MERHKKIITLTLLLTLLLLIGCSEIPNTICIETGEIKIINNTIQPQSIEISKGKCPDNPTKKLQIGLFK